jgi:hypothetical protein
VYVGFLFFLFFWLGLERSYASRVCGYVGGEGVTREGRKEGRKAGRREGVRREARER